MPLPEYDYLDYELDLELQEQRKGEKKMKTQTKWSLAIERKDGEEFVAILREEGKMDTSVDIHREQLPWFNALRELLHKES